MMMTMIIIIGLECQNGMVWEGGSVVGGGRRK
jgi:hypothetical protein